MSMEAQPSRNRTARKALVWACAFAVAAVISILLLSPGSSSQKVLPTCDASISTLKTAVENRPRQRALGVRVFEVAEVKEIETKKDESQEIIERWCSSKLFSNAGQKIAMWRLIWIDRDKGKWWLEIELIS